MLNRTKYESLDKLVLSKEELASLNNAAPKSESSNAGINVPAAAQSQVIKRLIGAAMKCTKAANALPIGNDFSYFTTFPEFQESSNELASVALSSLGALAGRVSHSTRADVITSPESLENEKFANIVCALDDTLLYVDSSINRMSSKNDKIHVGAFGPLPSSKSSSSNNKQTKGKGEQTVAFNRKPQDSFATPVDNSRNRWMPRITTKAHAAVPLFRVFASAQQDTTISYPHPYGPEIRSLAYASEIFAPKEAKLFAPLDETPCHWIESVDELEEMADVLCSQPAIAIDLEHHSHRTYLGIVCLMQISTRDADYLIDTIALRDELHVLNSSFADPRIVKVLHGSKMDILWLQRDLGLYIVNMFDTGDAARILEFQSFGLAYLLTHYCGVVTNKKYQLADWRLRPLTAEMMLYARQDTHYLLYIYDRMRTELIEKSLTLLRMNAKAASSSLYASQSIVKLVAGSESIVSIAKTEEKTYDSPDNVFLLSVCFNRSRETTLTTFEKEVVSAASGLQFEERFNLRLSDVQSRLLLGLLYWRDDVARKEDESTHFVLPNYGLIQIVSNPPKSVSALTRLLRPVPPLIQHNSMLFLDLLNNIMSLKGPIIPFFSSDDYQKFSFSMNSKTTKSAIQVGSEPITSTHLTDSSTMDVPSGSSMDMSDEKTLDSNAKGLDIQTYLASPAPTKQELYESAGWITTKPLASGLMSTPGKALFTGSSQKQKLKTPGSATSSLNAVKNHVRDLATECAASAQTLKNVSLKLDSIPCTTSGVLLFDVDGIASSENVSGVNEGQSDSMATPINITADAIKENFKAAPKASATFSLLAPHVLKTPVSGRMSSSMQNSTSKILSERYAQLRRECATSAHEFVKETPKAQPAKEAALVSVPESDSSIATPAKPETNPVDSVLSWDAETQTFVPTIMASNSKTDTPNSMVNPDLVSASSLPSPDSQAGKGDKSSSIGLPKSMREVYSLANRKKKSETSEASDSTVNVQGVPKGKRKNMSTAKADDEASNTSGAKRVQRSDDDVISKFKWESNEESKSSADSTEQKSDQFKQESNVSDSRESESNEQEGDDAGGEKLPSFRFAMGESPFANVSSKHLKNMGAKKGYYLPEDVQRRTMYSNNRGPKSSQHNNRGNNKSSSGNNGYGSGSSNPRMRK